MSLTDVSIRALKPEARRYSRTDERGLVLEVFPAGGMLWHYHPTRHTEHHLGQCRAGQEGSSRHKTGVVSRAP